MFRPVRYIGNKTRLLGFIRRVLRTRGIAAGVAVDPFTGTASVARELKRLGFRVVASDIMQYAYVFARAYVQAGRAPASPALAREIGLRDGRFETLIAHLNTVPDRTGFIHDRFCPRGADGRDHGRMYFTPANAARIDAVRETIEMWRCAALVDEETYHLLLASLIEAADRVANTTGVYAAFVKTWQANALRRMELRAPALVPGGGCRAQRADAFDVLADIEPFELLYLDPPYNARQYAGYYHIPELIATGWFDADIPLRGKTGLPPDEEKRSDWCRSRRCEAAFERLVATARWRRLVMSYNAEGIIGEAAIERTLKENGRRSTYRRHRQRYRRYRADTDGPNRRYRADAVYEYLYCIDR